MLRGKLIVFEGLDSSGKTYQLHKLYENLAKLGIDAVTCAEPGTTPAGLAVREALQTNMTGNTELLLFYAARSELVETVILPNLNAGKIVLCDRFLMSTQAYQGFGRQLDYNSISGLHYQFAHNLFPDFTIYMNIPLEESLRRSHKSGKFDRMNSQPEDFYTRVENGYSFEVQRLGNMEPDSLFIVNGMLPKWEVEQLVLDAVRQFLEV